MQRIEDKIKGPISTPIQAHQSDHQERDSKRDEVTKLDIPVVSQTQPKEVHTKAQIVGPSFAKGKELTDEVEVKME